VLFLKIAAGKTWTWLKRILPLSGAFFAVELLAFFLIQPKDLTGLWFGAFWALLLSGGILCLPRLAGRIAFGIAFYFSLLWMLTQAGYYDVFGKLMWMADLFFTGESLDYFGDVLVSFPLLWWLGGILLLHAGGLVIWLFPKPGKGILPRIPSAVAAVLAIVMLAVMPQLVFLKDNGVWGTRSEYAQSSSYRATYETMYDGAKTYNICGIYHLTFRDIWEHELYPLTPMYQNKREELKNQVDEYFAQRETPSDNEMTGKFAGKNVVLVLMESMDDWMITQEDTPTIYRMMEEGITFTDFYTPGYGTARTINSEFCMNTGIYLPTNGDFVFDYVTNDFNQTIASLAADNGYTAEVFHYNDPSFYSRGAFEPAMGYNAYNSYSTYVEDEKALYDENLLFDIPQMKELFFREGKTFNTVITRSAHLSYVYNEVLSHYALKQYPEYRNKYGSQEEDCARVKAKLVDDFFARLLQELEDNGTLEDTVIIAVTDHYTYGYKNLEELYAHSGVEHELHLEKTPCFVWSADCQPVEVEKTMNTADFVPTMENLLGFNSPYHYLGQDAFNDSYEGYAFFPDGSWISNGVTCTIKTGGEPVILENKADRHLSEEYIGQMTADAQRFIQISNLLLTTDYYSND